MRGIAAGKTLWKQMREGMGWGIDEKEKKRIKDK